ncbi:MAG: glycosyltransferase [Bacillota bacterium]|nr:glycosyltransferase [Bacillota bacterium]
MKTTLSLCMIAKNESDKIARCLASIKDFVDEIIVVDTGSTDSTREIARQYGARVFESRWENDFSKARNISLENASSDWILFLDCDEEISPESGPIIKKMIEEGPYEAYFVEVVNNTEVSTQLIVTSIRLFKNRPVYRFEGRIHEQIVYSIIRNYGRDSIGASKISIIHHGYNTLDVNIEAKIQRNMKILSSYSEEEKDGFYYYNLGTEYVRLGERQKALACYLQAAESTNPGQGFGPILVKKIITTLMELQRFKEAIRQLRYYQSLYTDFKDLFFLEAICHLNSGRYSQAMRYLQIYNEMLPSPGWYPTETRYFGVSCEELMEKVKTVAIERDYPNLTVCIIGQNEEDHIARCIKSVNEIAQEVLFMDMGSTDSSAAVAEEYGAEVYPGHWPECPLDLYQNTIEAASGEWILIMKADEVAANEAHAPITQTIKEGIHEGYVIKINTYLERNFSPVNTQVKGSYRLFRKNNKDGIKHIFNNDCPFRFAIDSLGLADIVLHHMHYHSKEEYISQKIDKKLHFIRENMESDSLEQLYALGVVHFYAHDYSLAARYFEVCLEKGSIENEAEFFYYYALALTNLTRYRKVIDILPQIIKRFPDYTDIIYLQAIAKSMLGNTTEAEELLQQCIQSGEAPWNKYICNPATGTLKAFCSLATIYAGRGNLGAALQFFVRAAVIAGGFEETVDSIVVLHDKLPLSMEKFLENNSILNAQNLGMVAQTYAKMKRYKESFHYLNLACEQAAKEETPELSVIYGVSEVLLSAFSREAAKNLPDDAAIRSLLIN